LSLCKDFNVPRGPSDLLRICLCLGFMASDSCWTLGQLYFLQAHPTACGQPTSGGRNIAPVSMFEGPHGASTHHHSISGTITRLSRKSAVTRVRSANRIARENLPPACGPGNHNRRM